MSNYPISLLLNEIKVCRLNRVYLNTQLVYKNDRVNLSKRLVRGDDYSTTEAMFLTEFVLTSCRHLYLPKLPQIRRIIKFTEKFGVSSTKIQ